MEDHDQNEHPDPDQDQIQSTNEDQNTPKDMDQSPQRDDQVEVNILGQNITIDGGSARTARTSTGSTFQVPEVFHKLASERKIQTESAVQKDKSDRPFPMEAIEAAAAEKSTSRTRFDPAADPTALKNELRIWVQRHLTSEDETAFANYPIRCAGRSTQSVFEAPTAHT